MNIYVGNLPHSTTEEALRELFSQFGDVTSVRIMRDKFTGALRGFAFVEMAAAPQAQEAIAELNNCDFGGQRLRVNEARPREARPAHRPNNRRPFNNKRPSF